MSGPNRQSRSQDPLPRRIGTAEASALSDDTLACGSEGRLRAIAIGGRAGDLELQRIAQIAERDRRSSAYREQGVLQRAVGRELNTER
jgi:hypothetical protein